MVNVGCVMGQKSLMVLHAELVMVLEYVISVMEIGGRHVPLVMGTEIVINAKATRFARHVKELLLVRPAVVTDIVRHVLTVTANVRTAQVLAKSACSRSLSPTVVAMRESLFTVRGNGRSRQTLSGLPSHVLLAAVTIR